MKVLIMIILIIIKISKECGIINPTSINDCLSNETYNSNITCCYATVEVNLDLISTNAVNKSSLCLDIPSNIAFFAKYINFINYI